MRPYIPTLLATTLFATTVFAQERKPMSGDTFTWSERMARGAELRVYDPNGRIDVTEATGDVAELRAERRDGRRAEVSFEIRRNGSDITICAIFSDSDCDDDGVRQHWRRWRDDDENHARVNLTVKLPKGVRLVAGTGNGEVSVTGAAADVAASSGNGRVRVSTSAGKVTASSGNGEVTVEGATDRVSASTGNGRVLVSTSKGPVTASSGNGDIDVRMLTLSDDEDMTFSTGNGRVQVALPSSFAGEVEGDLGHGEFRSDFPLSVKGRLSPHHIRATIGSGGPRVRMTSGNGDLELIKAGGK